MKSNFTNLLSLAALSCAVFVVSCQKEVSGPTTPASSAQDKTNLTSASSALGEAGADVLKTPGATAMVSAASVSKKKGPFSKDGQDITTEVMGRIISIYNYGRKGITNNSSYAKAPGMTTPINFSSICGTYTYRASDSSWAKSLGGSSVIINYPANQSASNSNNNAVLTITHYTEINVASDTSHDYLPTALNSNLTVDGNRVASLDFTASYNSDGIPTTLMLLLNVNPYSLAINFANQGSTMTGNVNFAKSGVTQIGFGASLNFADASQKKVSTVKSAYLQLMDVKLNGDIDAGALDNVPSNASMDQKIAADNANINIAVSYKGGQIGKIEFGKDSAGTATKPVAYIRFNDGSLDKLDKYFSPAKDKLNGTQPK
jgi:hypothetical protein